MESLHLLSESKYVTDILERARLTDNKTVDAPIEVNAKYSSSDGFPLSDPTLYRTFVGSLVYLTITRPDIAYDVHVVSQFVASPTTVHWAAVLRILQYLRCTVFQSLFLPSTFSLELRAYSDADHGSDPTDRKSVTGFCIFLGDYLISWKSKKQSIVSQSSTEAEYRAMASTTKEIVWLGWLLADMGVSFSHPTPMYCDNQSSIQIAHNSVQDGIHQIKNHDRKPQKRGNHPPGGITGECWTSTTCATSLARANNKRARISNPDNGQLMEMIKIMVAQAGLQNVAEL
ncbi:uncharacterized protein LOC116139772 [Pistacia vera]|uniref:uncharacterized protein LOC116139772 n=1 Tax=Pistacia vera TaxID=55513 RepID=UPI001262F18F|nr:uncharacterized protein LOC116139772 [Pistacia vera]